MANLLHIDRRNHGIRSNVLWYAECLLMHHELHKQLHAAKEEARRLRGEVWRLQIALDLERACNKASDTIIACLTDPRIGPQLASDVAQRLLAETERG